MQISSKARALAGTQEARRRKLNDKIQALVSASESAVAREALRWNTVRRRLTPFFLSVMHPRIKEVELQK